MKGLDPKTLVELVRLPAVLSVPGDTLLGRSSGAALRSPARAAGLAASSSLLYLAGMALNDYADRDVDSEERPQRPIPSGRIDAQTALHIAQALTLAGLLAAAHAGGRRSLAIALLLAADVWAYDLALKNTPVGPLSMASCRSLDVLLGTTEGSLRGALAPAAIVGAHILTVTGVSKFEVQGSNPKLARGALAATVGVTAVSAARLIRRERHRPRAVVAGAIALAAYIAPLVKVGRAAMDVPTPKQLQRFVGAGVIGVAPLQAALIASNGQSAVSLGVGTLWPIARHFSRKRSVT